MAFTSELNTKAYAGIIITFFFLATICVGLRLFARRISNIRFGLDDVWIVIAWVFLLATTIDEGICMNPVTRRRLFDSQTPSFLRCRS